MLKYLINLFIKKNGRSPNALEMLQLKFKAAQQSGKGKVFDMKGNPLDPNKPIIGGTQSEFQSGIIKAIKPKPTVVKQRGPQRGNDLRYNMSVTLHEAYSGKKSQIRIPSYDGCDALQTRWFS